MSAKHVWMHPNAELVAMGVCVHGWAVPVCGLGLQLFEVGHGEGE